MCLCPTDHSCGQLCMQDKLSQCNVGAFRGLRCGLIRPVLAVVVFHMTAISVSRVVRALGRFFFFLLFFFIRSIEVVVSSASGAAAGRNKEKLMLVSKQWAKNRMVSKGAQCTVHKEERRKCRNHHHHRDYTCGVFRKKCGKKGIHIICYGKTIFKIQTHLLVGNTTKWVKK